MQVTYHSCDFCGHRLDLGEGMGPPSFEFHGLRFDSCATCAAEVTLARALQVLQPRSPRIALPTLAARVPGT